MAVTWVKVRDHGVVHHVHWHAVLVWPLGTDLDVTGHRNCCWVYIEWPTGGNGLGLGTPVWDSIWGFMSAMPLDPGSLGMLGS